METWVEFWQDRGNWHRERRHRVRMAGKWPEFETWMRGSKEWSNVGLDRERCPSGWQYMVDLAVGAGVLEHTGYVLGGAS